MSDWFAASAALCAAGAVVTPVLVRSGLHALDHTGRAGATRIVLRALWGGAAVAAAALAAHHAGSAWWLLPFVAWALTLAAAAACDVETQRIPTRIVGPGALVIAALIVVAGIATHDWHIPIGALIGCVSAGAIVAIGWRFAGIGFGDVRLAAVGGLGLGHATSRAIEVGLFGFALVSLAGAVWTFLRTRDRKASFAYGPALVVGFLLAAAG